MKVLTKLFLRPFGYDVDLGGQNDHQMPSPECCKQDGMVRILRSSGDGWLSVRAAITENAFFLSKSTDINTASHVVPLHEVMEVTKSNGLITRASSIEQIAEHESLETSEVLTESRSTDTTLEIVTVENGYNFGRVFSVQIGNTMIDEWLKDLEHNRVKETRAFNRRTYIQRKQRVLSHFYESKIVQYIVAALIVMNFFIEAFRQVAIL